MKVGSIKQKMFISRIVKVFFGILTQPVVLDGFKLEGAVTGLFGKLPDGVAFHDPEFKPMPFIEFFDIRLFPNKRFETTFASKSLPVVRTFSKQLNTGILTVGTMFFLTSFNPFLEAV